MRGAPTTARPRFIEKQRALADAYHKCNLANYAQALGKAHDLGLHLAEVKAVKEQRRTFRDINRSNSDAREQLDELIDSQTKLLATVQGEEQMKLEKSLLLKLYEARSERRGRLLMQESFFDLQHIFKFFIQRRALAVWIEPDENHRPLVRHHDVMVSVGLVFSIIPTVRMLVGFPVNSLYKRHHAWHRQTGIQPVVSV